MTREIRKDIYGFEQKHGASVITCRDYGSRMMHLDSPTSDIDARILFVQPAELYATVGDHTDVCSFNRGDVGYTAWNIDHFAERLADSNPAAIEFINSPLVYFDHPSLVGSLRTLRTAVNKHFDRTTLYRHYIELARSNYVRYIHRPEHFDTDISIKRYLLIIRNIMNAQYIKSTDMVPELHFGAFANQYAHRFMGPFVEEPDRLLHLIERRRTGDERYELIENYFKTYIEHQLSVEWQHPDTFRVPEDAIDKFVKQALHKGL